MPNDDSQYRIVDLEPDPVRPKCGDPVDDSAGAAIRGSRSLHRQLALRQRPLSCSAEATLLTIVR